MLKHKINKLKEIITALPKPIYLACSGGLDSRLLAFFAKQYKQEIHLLHVKGQHIDIDETNFLKIFAKNNEFPLTFIEFDLFRFEHLKYNHPSRCYYCKYEVFSAMLAFCKNNKLCDGTHFDDTKTHRPGLKALEELNIISPFALSGFTKNDIRQLALEIQLENPHQQAKPCLLTRFRYNSTVTEEKLQFIYFAEHNFKKILEEKHVKPPAFRIREVADQKYEIHCTESLELSLIQGLQAILQRTKIISNYDLSFKKVEILSGFFDLNP